MPSEQARLAEDAGSGNQKHQADRDNSGVIRPLTGYARNGTGRIRPCRAKRKESPGRCFRSGRNGSGEVGTTQVRNRQRDVRTAPYAGRRRRQRGRRPDRRIGVHAARLTTT